MQIRVNFTIIINQCILHCLDTSEQSKDKADRATLEKALNRGTVMVLYKMLNKIYTGESCCC